MTVSRKLFRLFKWLNEYVQIRKLLASDYPKIDKCLYILTKMAFFMYWVFDNLGILIKIKFLSVPIQLNNINRRASQFWLIGLVLVIIHTIRNLMNVSADFANL
jgi:hypothetical protein